MGVGDKVPPGKVPVADSNPEKPGIQGDAKAAAERPGKEQPLGRLMSSARESRGLSAADVAREAHVPEHYVRMIESDDYSLIADQLYLLPFLRRYAQFVGLDPEEIAGRFVRDVQRADVSAARMSEPIPMAERGQRSDRRMIVAAALALAFALVAAGVVIWHVRTRTHPVAAVPAPAAVSAPNAHRAPAVSPSAAPIPAGQSPATVR